LTAALTETLTGPEKL